MLTQVENTVSLPGASRELYCIGAPSPAKPARWPQSSGRLRLTQSSGLMLMLIHLSLTHKKPLPSISSTYISTHSSKQPKSQGIYCKRAHLG